MDKEKCDVALVSPMEVSLRQNKLTRDNKILSDVENFKKSKVNSLYLKQFRENIGIGSLAAFLREKKYNVKIINCNIEQLDIEGAAEQIIDMNPIVVGISLLYDLHIFNGFKLARLLKDKGYRGHITVGGAFSTLAYKYILEQVQAVDSVIRGEGEIPLFQLVQALQQEKAWRNIRGLAYIENGRVAVNEDSDAVQDLSVLPFTARDSLKELHKSNINVKVASIYSSRGCKGRCTYCTAPSLAMLYKGKWRYRNARHVVDEMECLVKEFGITYFYFCDDNFFGYGQAAKQRIEEMCNEIIKRGLKIRFHAEVRVDHKLDEALLMLLKAAGLKDVLLGIESGSQSVLNRWKKGTTVKQNLGTIKLLKGLGFNIEPAMILIDAEMTREEFRETVMFIEEAELHKTEFPLNIFNKMIVFTETQLYQNYLKQGTIIKEVFEKAPSAAYDFEASLMRLCKQVSYSQYIMQDKKLESMWDALMIMISELNFLTEDYFPAYSEDLINKSRQKGGLGKDSCLKGIQQVKMWRRGIGELCLELLKCCCQWLDKEAGIEDLEVCLRKIMSDYHLNYLGQEIYDDMHTSLRYALKCAVE